VKYNIKVAHIVTEVIQLELEVTMAVFSGHRPSDDDKFVGHRKRLKELRSILKLDKSWIQ
jgi:hypothetical protein